MNHSHLSSLLATLTLFTFTVGCTAGGYQGTPQSSHKNNVHDVRENISNLSSQEIAQHLVALSRQNSDVRNASAVVVGRTALVGLDLDKDTPADHVGIIKHTVTQALRNDPYGANAIVTSDPDLVQRIRNVGKAVKEGKPISGIQTEISAIVERIIPETPTPYPPKGTPQAKSH